MLTYLSVVVRWLREGSSRCGMLTVDRAKDRAEVQPDREEQSADRSPFSPGGRHRPRKKIERDTAEGEHLVRPIAAAAGPGGDEESQGERDEWSENLEDQED